MRIRGVLYAISLFMLILQHTVVCAENNDSLLLANQRAAILSVRTVGGELPTCDFIWPPEGANGIGVTNANKVPGRVILTEGDSLIFDSGDYNKDQSGMTIKVRGNTSAYYFNKFPYKIKLEKKGDLLGRGDSSYYDKNWVLLHEGDSKLNTLIGLKLNELLGLGGWTPAYKFVNLILNGDNLGVYMLVEQVRRNRDCRINVDKVSGYLFERDSYWWNEDIYFKSQLGKEYTFKYPDSDDITTEQIYYLQQAVETMEQAIISGYYDNYINTPSFAAWLLAQDILGTYDSGGANIFLTKYDNSDTTKITMATLWDFDSAFRNTNKWARIHESNFFYFPLLLNSANRSFATCYYKLWQEKGNEIFDKMEQFLNNFLHTDECRKLDYSRILDGNRYACVQPTVNRNVNDALKWFRERKVWLNTNINKIETAIGTSVRQQTEHNIVYDLRGMHQKDNLPNRKLIIYGGRKYVSH